MISFNLPTIGQVKSHDWYMIMSQNDSTQIAPCWRFSKKMVGLAELKPFLQFRK